MAFPLARFQEEAVERARVVLTRRGGVVLADSVGLGKTFVALALAEAALRAGLPVTVVVPAALRSSWRGRLRGLRSHVGAAPGAVHLLTHTRLGRGGFSSERLRATRLLVVDEAHAFRTPTTRRHRALAAACPCADVVLLTATPVNNRLEDLHHLLRLFAADDAFRDLGIPSLTEAFRARDCLEIRRIVREVVVRRTRGMLVRRYGAVSVAGDPVRFPRRLPPRVVRYDDPRLTRLVELIKALELPMVEAGPGTAALVRLGLLKRLESGGAALRRSVQRQLATTRAFADALSRGRLLTARDRPLVRGDDAGDPCQLVLEELVLDALPPHVDPRELSAAAARDLVRLRRMSARLDGPDPKVDGLRRVLSEVPPDERVVVFTEFRDTAEALWRALLPRHRVGRIDGSGAWLGARPAGRRTVLERFAPRAAGRPDPPERERVDVLIATDVLAEGLDLQDARHVVCYDLPWNPVRLLQRIGRVDRLGSPHESVVPHLFVSGAGLEAVLALTRTLATKLDRIAGSVATEDATALLAALAKGPAAAERALERADEGEEDPLERLRTSWIELRGGEADGSGLHGPPCAAEVNLPGAPSSAALVLMSDRLGRPRLLEVAGGVAREPGRLAAEAMEVAVRDPSPGRGANGWAGLDDAVAAARRYLAAEAAMAAAPAVVGPRAPGRAAARRVRQALLAAGPAPPEALVRRADEALARLSRPLRPHQGGAAREAAELGPATPEAVVQAAEAAVSRGARGEIDGREAGEAHAQRGRGGPPSRERELSAAPGPRPRLVAVLRLHPAEGR